MLEGVAYPASLQRLIDALSRLPGIGKRTAERLALALLEWPDADLADLGEHLAHLHQTVTTCTVCGYFSDGELCAICRDPRRQTDILCVVETAVQIPVLERSGSFRGLYHVLGGRIAPLQGRGPEDLSIPALRRRLERGNVRELILATSLDVEGEATAAFLAAELATFDVRVSRIAAGVPVGADLSYADAATLASAIVGRRTLR